MFSNILVPMDGSPLAECVLPHVVTISNVFAARATLVQALELADPSSGQIIDPLGWQMVKIEAQNYLEGIAQLLHQAGLQVDCQLIDGQAANSIIDFAHSKSTDLIILSSHGRSGLSAWNVSSVVQKIVQRAHLPYMIIRAYEPRQDLYSDLKYQTLLVPLDSSQRAECVLPIATRLASYFQARLLVVHVVARPEMPHRMPLSVEDIALADRLTERNCREATKYLEQIKNRLTSKNVNVQTRLLLKDNVAFALHELVEQENVDLVVMSAHGYSGKTRWPYGNVVEKFITYGATPLLIYQDYKPNELDSTHAEIAMRQIKGR
jgi:nucleotide-binding universal stress UspA family protein